MNLPKTLPGINIQWPISQQILDGSKTIETRTYEIPQKYIGKEMVLIETPGKTGKFKARGIAIIIFEDCFKYKNKTSFYKDVDLHKVQKGSIWDWKDKPKFGWKVKVVYKFQTSFSVPSNRGYIFCSDIPIQSN